MPCLARGLGLGHGAGDAREHAAVEPGEDLHGGGESGWLSLGAALTVAYEDDGLAPNVGQHLLLIAAARVDHAEALVAVERRDHALHAPAVVEVEAVGGDPDPVPRQLQGTGDLGSEVGVI